MRIALPVVFVALLGSVAVADHKQDVDAIVRKRIEKTADVMAVGADVLVKGGHVKPEDADQEIVDLHGDYAQGGGGSWMKVGKLEVVADDASGTAWFHGRAISFVQVDPKQAPTENPLRINGIAVKDKTWKIVALSYTEEISDQDMIERAQHVEPKLAIPAAVVTRGDPALAKVAGNWFSAAAIAGGASRGGKLVANGTAASEYQSGAAATKLAASWDKLKLAPYKIEAKTFANGRIGFVRVVVAMAVAKPKRIVPLVLSAVVVQEKGEWRWVSLNWTDFSVPPNSDPVDVK